MRFIKGLAIMREDEGEEEEEEEDDDDDDIPKIISSDERCSKHCP